MPMLMIRVVIVMSSGTQAKDVCEIRLVTVVVIGWLIFHLHGCMISPTTHKAVNVLISKEQRQGSLCPS